jgi:hypothetical protein
MRIARRAAKMKRSKATAAYKSAARSTRSMTADLGMPMAVVHPVRLERLKLLNTGVPSSVVPSAMPSGISAIARNRLAEPFWPTNFSGL